MFHYYIGLFRKIVRFYHGRGNVVCNVDTHRGMEVHSNLLQLSTNSYWKTWPTRSIGSKYMSTLLPPPTDSRALSLSAVHTSCTPCTYCANDEEQVPTQVLSKSSSVGLKAGRIEAKRSRRVGSQSISALYASLQACEVVLIRSFGSSPSPGQKC